MKKITIFLILLLNVNSLFSQSDSLHKHMAHDSDLIVGECKRFELQRGKFGEFFFEEYRNYEPDREILDNIKNKIFDCSITVVIGSWCHDSHQQVPRFMKILDVIDYNTNYLVEICVDKEKAAGDYDISALNIEKVPTFIVFRDNKELGRIIESPINTLELDLNNILNE